jgi:hypothetical protein
MKLILPVSLVLALAGTPARSPAAAGNASVAAATPESEPDDIRATANFLGGTAQGLHDAGVLRPGDVDVWSPWPGLQAGPSEWGLLMSAHGRARLEVSVAQLLLTPLGLVWRRLAHGRGDGLVRLAPIDFARTPQGPVPCLFMRVRGDPQACSITVP